MNPVYAALDTADLQRAATLAEAVRPHVGGLKLGLEFFAAQGPAGAGRLAALGLPIFLDLKLHDIPNTVAGAVRSLAPLAPAILSVHAGGGRAMMMAARDAAPPGTKVVAVTVLTSLDEPDLAEGGILGSAPTQVARLAELARNAGLDGIVCSAQEVGARRAAWPDGLFVVPGLRSGGGAEGDQKRVATPRAARDAGASVLVIGRPISAAPDPAEAARAIAAGL